jgi:CheY-like chemotaxis protein
MKRILYVEDSLTAQIIARRILGESYELSIAASPRMGNTLLQQGHYDLVITDVMFPQGDGLDVIVPLRQRKTALDIPIIAISGSMDTALANRLLKAGVNACLAKPINPLQFRTLVDRLLTTPFVESHTHLASTVYCFQWFEQGEYHEYCPELKIHLTGLERPALSDRMLQAITDHVAHGEPVGFTSQERVHAYRIEPPAAQA